jgi:hypothetical protein
MKKFIALFLAGLILLAACGAEMPAINPENNEDDTEPSNCGSSVPPIELWVISTPNFKNELIKQFSSLHSASGVKGFYYPAIEFDGLELYYAEGGENALFFSFGPVGITKKAGSYHFSYETNVEIVIEIPENRHIDYRDKDIDEYLRIIARDNSYAFTEDGFVYKAGDSMIMGGINGRTFRLEMPKHMTDYESLRDLAFEFIETAELITIGDVSTSSTPENNGESEGCGPLPTFIFNPTKAALAAELDEFYFPTSEIDGFSLSHVTIMESLYIFVYTADGRDSYPYIAIEIARDESLKIPQYDGYTFEGGLAYNHVHKDISGYIGGIYFRIRSPDKKLSSFEYLNELALEFIETAELITIE